MSHQDLFAQELKNSSTEVLLLKAMECFEEYHRGHGPHLLNRGRRYLEELAQPSRLEQSCPLVRHEHGGWTIEKPVFLPGLDPRFK